jgi:hypothetical protein
MGDDLDWEVKKNIDHIIDEVAIRGWADNQLQADDFAELRMDARFRDAQLAGLYEQYFLPERHEFEWLVLSEIVRAVVHSPVTGYVASTVALGVLGNAAFALLKKMCIEAANSFRAKLGTNGMERANGFESLAADAEKIQSFFGRHPKARIDEIERETGLARERIHPLLKLAGLRHYRRENACYWELPLSNRQIETTPHERHGE